MTALSKLQLKQLWKAYFQPTSADFSNLIDSWADYNFTATGTSAVARPVISKLGDIVSVKDFGAVGDGVTDDTAAIQAAISALVAAGGGTLYVPSGAYRVSSRITATCGGQQHISVKGDGRYQSVFDFSGAASLGLHLNSTSMLDNQLPSFEVRDVGFITSRDNAGTAIEFSYANSNNIDATVLAENVAIAQNVDRISDQGSGYGYWTTGIKCTNARNGEIRNLHCFGEMQKSPSSSRGVWLAGESTAFVVSDSLFLEWTTGIEAGGTSEGLYIDNTDIVYCRYGARHNISSGGEPQFTAVGCSFNCSDVGVWLTNSIGSVVADSLFFAASALDAGPWPEWTGVKIDGVNSRFNKIVGCTFTKESQRTGDITVGMDFNQGRGYSESANHFFGLSGNELTYGVIIRSGVSNVRVDSNGIYEYVTSRLANSGTQSIKQKLVQAGTATVSSAAVISFPQAFDEAPVVVAGHVGTNTGSDVTVTAVSATAFTVHHGFGGAAAISWIAAGN